MAHSGREGGTHFESASSILAPFKTKSAITAQRVLALRMNCLKLLYSCDPSSRFSVANIFFNQAEARFSNKPETSNLKWSPQEYGIYIDNFTEMFLDALNAYYNEDYQVLEELCLQIEKHIRESERNNRDKLTLLKARTAIKKKEASVAKRFYQMLRYHPDFGEEAKEMLE
jgi:hypothetical protein